MKFIFACFFLCILVSGCNVVYTPTPAQKAQAFTPAAPTARATNLTVPTSDATGTANATATPRETGTIIANATASSSVTATATAPATLSQTVTAPAIATASQSVARHAPEMLGRLKLLDLPGAGRSPAALALVGHAVYVANRDSANIGAIYDERVRDFIGLEGNPTALGADPAHQRIYAATYETPTLYLIENDRISKQGAVDGHVNALAVTSDTLYVGLDNDAIVERYDANTLIKKDELKLAQGFSVGALVADAAHNRLYVGEYGRIVAIDLSTFHELMSFAVPMLYSGFAVNPTDGSVWGGAYDEASSRAYVVGYKPDGQELARLFIGAELETTAFDSLGRLYALDRFDNRVYVIQTPEAQVVATIPVNESPSAAVFDPVDNVVYVANQNSDNVSVIDGAALRVSNTIPLANAITALAANPARHRVYAANSSTNSVYVLEGDKVVGEVHTGNAPVDLAVDAAAKRLYVANRADGTLDVIDEDSLQITASQYITRFLSTVAVDSENHKLFAGSTELNPETLKPEATFFAKGSALNSLTTAQYVRANPALKKLYALASNGVPGSNSRVTLYRFAYDKMESQALGSKNGGNTTALAIDPTTNELFATNTHPLAFTSGLDVFDAQDELVFSLPQGAHTTALVINPTTHHLFLAHAQTFQFGAGLPPAPDNLVEILDTRTFGQVAVLPVPNAPFRMALLDNTVYVASYDDGMITLIGDAVTEQPSAPTPTLTPSPYPTFATTGVPPTATPAAVVPTQTVVAECVNTVPVQFAPFRSKVDKVGIAELGCTRGAEKQEQNFAYQPLERGFMIDDYRDANAKKVYVFFPDGTYKIFDDTFRDGENDTICPQVNVPAGKWRPKRGFGMVWCNVPEVQALGAGLEEEHNTPMNTQAFGNAMLWFTDARGLIVLWNDGVWQ